MAFQHKKYMYRSQSQFPAPVLALFEGVWIKKTATVWPLGRFGHQPVAVDWALIHLDTNSLWGKEASRRRLQLCPHSAHTGVCLKSVWPAMRVLVHHLQQVADCSLGGCIWVLSKIKVEIIRLTPLLLLLGKAMVKRKCAQPLRSQSQCSATCWQVPPSPPSTDKLTAGVLQRWTFQQLMFERT